MDGARRQLVLHLVESYGGGLQSALQAYIERTPEYDHLVLAHTRQDICVKLPPTVQVIDVDKSLISQYRRGVRALREFSPDLIHAHSSWAGFYGRILGRRHHVPVVYSPHAFAFLRTDRSKWMRRMYLRVERWLARYTASYVTASTHEAHLAMEFGLTATHHIAFPALSPSTVSYLASAPDDREEPYDIALLGRIVAQKSPEFLVATIAQLRKSGWSGSVKWIGHGGDDYLELLKEAGVEITGWLPRDEALRELSRARILLHCGEWEAGIPYAVVEAAAIGLPVVMRSLPSATDIEGCSIGTTPADCARWILSLLYSDTRYDEARKHALNLMDERWAFRQRASLLAAYDDAAPALADIESLELDQELAAVRPKSLSPGSTVLAALLASEEGAVPASRPAS